MDKNVLKELKRLRVYDDEGNYVMTFMEAFNIIKNSFRESMKDELDKMFQNMKADEVVKKPIGRPRNCFDVFYDPNSKD